LCSAERSADDQDEWSVGGTCNDHHTGEFHNPGTERFGYNSVERSLTDRQLLYAFDQQHFANDGDGGNVFADDQRKQLQHLERADRRDGPELPHNNFLCGAEWSVDHQDEWSVGWTRNDHDTGELHDSGAERLRGNSVQWGLTDGQLLYAFDQQHFANDGDGGNVFADDQRQQLQHFERANSSDRTELSHDYFVCGAERSADDQDEWSVGGTCNDHHTGELYDPGTERLGDNSVQWSLTDG
jgi:hypothetical protein